MLHTITVGNHKHGARGEYIGRPQKGQKPSPLRNRWSSKDYGGGIKVGSVAESIACFERDLEEKIARKDPEVMAELTRLFRKAQQGPLTLVCWCAPGPCHGDVVKKVLERTARKMQG